MEEEGKKEVEEIYQPPTLSKEEMYFLQCEIDEVSADNIGF